MLRACPHHGFTELAQIDTFYNGLNDNDQDSLNAVAGGNLLSKTTREALDNASKSDVRIDKLADQISTLVDIFAKKIVTPTSVKAVEESCVTCRGAHAYYNCPNTDSNQPSVCVATGTLLSNTIPNPKGEMKAITTRSGVAYEGPSIPTPKKVVEQETEETTDKEQTNFQGTMLLKKLPEKLGDPGKFLIPCDFPRIDVCHTLADLDASIKLMPLCIWKNLSLPELSPTRMTLELADRCITRPKELADRCITHPKGVAKDVFVKVGKFHCLTDFVVVDFEADPRIPLILGRSFLRTGRALIDVYGEEITLRVDDEAVTFNLNQNTRYSSTYDDLSVNRIDIIDVAREEYAQEILSFSYNSSGGNPTLTFEPILSNSSPSLNSFEGSADKLPLRILKDLRVDEKEALLKVLKSHKRAIAWKITDIKGIDPRFYTRKILMADVQSSRRVNPKIHAVIKKEVIKLLDAGMIYLISDSPWVGPIHCVPKKGGITVVENENNELIPTRGIVLGHKISKNGLEVYRSKVDVIAKLPYPTTMKGVRSFLGHASFYRRIIQDFSKIARPMTRLLEKETPYVFSKDCIDAFETLKRKLTEAPILVVPDWNLPFELMSEASDFTIGAVGILVHCLSFSCMKLDSDTLSTSLSLLSAFLRHHHLMIPHQKRDHLGHLLGNLETKHPIL
nr:hypothetical protein [Tanacetum cinerariifolium]